MYILTNKTKKNATQETNFENKSWVAFFSGKQRTRNAVRISGPNELAVRAST